MCTFFLYPRYARTLFFCRCADVATGAGQSGLDPPAPGCDAEWTSGFTLTLTLTPPTTTTTTTTSRVNPGRVYPTSSD